MRILSTLVSLGAIGYGLFWVNEQHPELKNHVMEYINSQSFHTLEVRFTPKQIMEQARSKLLRDGRHKFLDPVTKFRPYLLMEVKYTKKNQGTGEGVILWDLVDGEMVINATSWEKTHGFSDCINASAERYEFKVLNLLSSKGGALDREGLIKALHVEDDILDTWIERCRRKKLIVQSGNDYRLHLEKPRINVIPSTKIEAPLVTTSFNRAERQARRFSPAQIKRIAASAFGNDFAIRTTIDVYLPIYSITVQNPDGSLHTTHWNALNGRLLSNKAALIN